MSYTPIIGLEIHAELTTKSKIFCSCENGFGGKPNTRCCPVCCGFPGTLPVLNRNVVRYAVLAGHALGCTVNSYSSFDRKNYFYPDLPKAYQITQAEKPICVNGNVNGIRIKQIHIEEDAGKLVHEDGISKADYNRCGVPLIEIVTQPDIRDANTAKEFVKEIASRLKYAGVCNAKMEEGSLRCDVNISLMKDGVTGTRAEIKNINSVRAIGRAIEYEIERQSRLLDEGKKIPRETRRFDSEKGITQSLRSKEDAQDYRYFPEPDIKPILLTKEDIENIKSLLPELAHIRKERYIGHGLTKEEATLLVSEKYISDIYDDAVLHYVNKKGICTMITVELFRLIGNGADISLVTGEKIAELVKASDEGTISKNDAKRVLEILCKEEGNPLEIAKKYELIMSQDRDATEKTVKAVIEANPKAVKEYLDGSQKVLGYLIGQCVRAIGKGANPAFIKEILLQELKA